jgi:GNAT superfamily N-acetyltransferase
VCGLNVDPYSSDPTIGRVRRLNVVPASRGHGVGFHLIQAVVHAARGRFRSLRVRTENAEAGRLYERLEFDPAARLPDCTHFLRPNALQCQPTRGDGLNEDLVLRNVLISLGKQGF